MPRAALILVALALVGAGCGCAGGATGSQEREGARAGRAPARAQAIDAVREQDGVSVELLRLKRVGRGGRVYLRATNDTDLAASVLPLTSELLQDGEGLQPSPDPAGRTPDIGGEIEGGDARVGTLFYRVLARGPARLSVDWFSRDIDISPRPFEFTFRVR